MARTGVRLDVLAERLLQPDHQRLGRVARGGEEHLRQPKRIGHLDIGKHALEHEQVVEVAD